MMILGIDPGGTTGLCVIENKDGWWVRFEAEIADIPSLGKTLQQIRLYGGHVVVESVVAHGQLTIGKMLQLKAVGVIESVLPNMVWITPEERGRVKKAPRGMVGKHAQDAYRVAVAFALKEGLMTKDDAEYLSTTAERWDA